MLSPEKQLAGPFYQIEPRHTAHQHRNERQYVPAALACTHTTYLPSGARFDSVRIDSIRIGPHDMNARLLSFRIDSARIGSIRCSRSMVEGRRAFILYLSICFGRDITVHSGFRAASGVFSSCGAHERLLNQWFVGITGIPQRHESENNCNRSLGGQDKPQQIGQVI